MLIVIPSYNRLEHVKKSIVSVRRDLKFCKQKHKLVVVDNGSKDGTAEWLCENIPNRKDMELLQFNINIGKARAVNMVVNKNTEWEYFCSYDSDLVIEKHNGFFDKMQEMFAYMNTQRDFDIVCINQEGNSVHDYRQLKYRYDTPYGYVYFNLKGRGMAGSCLVMRTDKFLSVGGYRTNTGIYGGNDGLLIDAVLRQGKDRKVGVIMDMIVKHLPENDKGYAEYKRNAVAKIQESGYGTAEEYWKK